MKKRKMIHTNSEAYALFRAGNDSMAIAGMLKISEPDAVKAIIKAREEKRRDHDKSAIPPVYQSPVEDDEGDR